AGGDDHGRGGGGKGFPGDRHGRVVQGFTVYPDRGQARGCHVIVAQVIGDQPVRGGVLVACKVAQRGQVTVPHVRIDVLFRTNQIRVGGVLPDVECCPTL